MTTTHEQGISVDEVTFGRLHGDLVRIEWDSTHGDIDEPRAWLNTHPDGTVLRNQAGEVFVRRDGTWWEAATETGPGRISLTSRHLTVIYTPKETA